MLTSIKVLTLMSNVNEALDDYVASHTSAAHPYLYQLYRATHTQLIRPRMASGPLQGRLLRDKRRDGGLHTPMARKLPVVFQR